MTATAIPQSDITPALTSSTPPNGAVASSDELKLKVDSLEQKSFSNIILCSGSEVGIILSEPNANYENKIRDKLRNFNVDINDSDIDKKVL